MAFSLKESKNRIHSLSIIILCRNSQGYLKGIIAALKAIEVKYDCSISYIFVENGSWDETPIIIRNFIDERDGYYLAKGNNELLDLVDRPRRLGYLRNLSTLYLAEIKSDWTLLVDTDVYFSWDVLESLFSKDPSRNGVGMLCAFGIEAAPADETRLTWNTQNHYYDTAAFVTDAGESNWPRCMFMGCVKCQSHPGAGQLPNTGLLKVKSAFGGMALVRTDLLRNRAVRWKAVPAGEGSPECEHIGFCESLTRESGLSVAVDCDTKVLWDVTTYGG